MTPPEPRPGPDLPGALVLTCDLPFFPGKMGVDFFNLRALAARWHVGVVGPRYDVLPEAGLANLRGAVQDCFFWPDGLAPGQDLPRPRTGLLVGGLARAVPPLLAAPLLRLLLGLRPSDDNGHLKRAVLANLAPYLLQALRQRPWRALVVIQSDTRPWLDFLPPQLPLAVYFHDVRSDYLARRAEFEPEPRRFRSAARRARDEERTICQRAEAVGFVSALDWQRAEAAFGPLPRARVAEIPLDLDYFTPRPPGPAVAAAPTALFTGLLAHPPNADAARWLAREIWPRVRAEHPGARLLVAGAFPSQELARDLADCPGVELVANPPDIRPLFWQAQAYVVPMRFGGGVRQKILEAWAMRVPVVLTPMAGEGAGIEHGRNCLVGRDAAELAGHLTGLLRDPGTAAALLDEGQRRVRARHALEVACPGFEALVADAAARRRAAPPRVLLDLSWLRAGDDGPRARHARRLARALAPWGGLRLLAPRARLRELLVPGDEGRGLASDAGLRPRLERWAAALANRLAERVVTHLPASTALLELRALRRLDAELAHVFQGSTAAPVDALPQLRTLFEVDPGDQAEARACQAALRVLCPSEETRQAACRAWGLRPERVRVVPAAADPAARARLRAWLVGLYDEARDELLGDAVAPRHGRG